MSNKTLRDILRERIAALGTSATAVSVKAGLGRTALPDFLRGRAQSAKYDNVEAYAQALGYADVAEMVLDGREDFDAGLMRDAIVAMLMLIEERQPDWSADKAEVARLMIELYRLQRDQGRDPAEDPRRIAEAICRGAGLNLSSRRARETSPKPA